MTGQLPSEITRFLLTSVPSVPYLEAMLLLRQEESVLWDGNGLARRLYIQEKKAAALLSELREAGILAYADRSVPTYRFSPMTDELRQLIDQLAAIYARHIVEISNLIHSRTSNQVQQFADAFKLRKDS